LAWMRVRDLHRGPARNDVNGITIRRGAPTHRSRGRCGAAVTAGQRCLMYWGARVGHHVALTGGLTCPPRTFSGNQRPCQLEPWPGRLGYDSIPLGVLRRDEPPNRLEIGESYHSRQIDITLGRLLAW
jgi:hypothetical protein